MEPKDKDLLGALEAAPGWAPDTARAWERYRNIAAGHQRRVRTLIWTTAGATVAVAGLLAFPVTRVFAERCVAACVSETAAIGQKLGFRSNASPDFALTDASGNMVRLSDFRGKVVLLNFWATWCHPCKVEMPWFVEFQRKYEAEGLVVLGVSMDEDGWAAVRPLLEKTPVNFRMMIGTDQVAKDFGGVEMLPSTFVIDRQGGIAATHAGIVDRVEMEQHLKTQLAVR